MSGGAARLTIVLVGCGRLGFDAQPGTTIGDGRGGGSGDGAIAAGPPCGTMVRYSEPFTSLDAAWTVASSPDVTIVVANNRALFTFPASATSSTGGTLDHPATIDMTSACIDTSLLSVPLASSGAYTELLLQTSGVGSVLWFEQSGMLIAGYTNPANCVFGIAGMAPFDPVNHHFLRVHESAGALYWSASPDGVTYMPFATLDPDGIDVSATFIRLDAFATAVGTTGGETSWGPLTITGP